MAKHLHFVSKPLHLFIQSQLGLNYAPKQALVLKDDIWSLDPITHIARIQGIAFFNQTFFEVLENKSFKDPETQWKIYSKLVINRQFIIEICEHSQLLDAFTIDRTNNANTGEICFTALSIVLWDMHCKKETKQAKQIIRSFIEHYITQLFPATQMHQPTQAELIKNIKKSLFDQWGVKPDIKESFKTTNDSVEFSLIAKTTDFHPVALITLKGKRLKPTRKKCYQRLLDLLNNEFSTIPKLVPKALKKKVNIKPLE